MNLLKQIENEQVAKLTAGKDIPEFQPGDTVIVNVKVVEGERSRVQAYEGRRGEGGAVKRPAARAYSSSTVSKSAGRMISSTSQSSE